MKLRPYALAGLLGLCVALAPSAFAEEEEGNDLSKQIQEKMEKILELMKSNETALLKLSTGKEAVTKKVDVPVPPGEKAPKGGGGGAGLSQDEIAKRLEELIGTHRKEGGSIPGEIKELVKMIPL